MISGLLKRAVLQFVRNTRAIHLEVGIHASTGIAIRSAARKAPQGDSPMSSTPPQPEGRRALKWAAIGAIEAAGIAAGVLGLADGLILGSDTWPWKAACGALIGAVGGGIGGALYGGKARQSP